MRSLARVATFVLIAAGLVGAAPRARAACHSFTVSAPNTVSEGNRIPVRIEREAAVNPSSVRVTTVAGSAESPSDFTAVNERVQFTNETSRMITILTVEDSVTEQAENFAIRLSDGRGCSVNPNFQYGPPERVTISDDDVATPTPVMTTPPPATSAPPIAAPTSSPTISPSPGSPSPTATPSPTLSPTVTPIALPIDASDDDFPWVPVALGIGIVAAGAGALVFTRMRRGAAPGP
jgi:hypothetical protein